MISSLKFKSGYPTRLPDIRRKTLEFGRGLSLLLGPNGSGKSTILKTLGTFAGCGRGGWSVESENRELPFEVDVDWDGRPVFFQDCYANSGETFLDPDYFEEKKYLRSTGEIRIGLINELIDHLEDRFLTYKLKKTDRPTLLLDEVDNHIGFAAQAIFWRDIVPLLIKKYQLVVSSHSIFPILLRKDGSLRNDTVVSLYKGYDNLCIGELADAIDAYNSRKAK